MSNRDILRQAAPMVPISCEHIIGDKYINTGAVDGTTTVLEEGEELWVMLEFWGDLVLNGMFDLSIIERCRGDHSKESMENSVLCQFQSVGLRHSLF